MILRSRHVTMGRRHMTHHVTNRGNQSTDQQKNRDSPYEEKSPKGFPTGPKKDRASAQQCAVLRSSYWNSAIQLTNVPLYHIRIYATRSLYFTCPQGLCTDHPVLVYKTCEFSGIVLRLFSCLPPRVPTIEPISPLLFFILLCLSVSQVLLLHSLLQLQPLVSPHYST